MKTFASSLLALLLFILTVQNSYSYTNSYELLPDSTITIGGVSSSLSGNFNFGPNNILILDLPSGDILSQPLQDPMYSRLFNIDMSGGGQSIISGNTLIGPVWSSILGACPRMAFV